MRPGAVTSLDMVCGMTDLLLSLLLFSALWCPQRVRAAAAAASSTDDRREGSLEDDPTYKWVGARGSQRVVRGFKVQGYG